MPKIKLRKVSENIWKIKKEKGMLVPGIVFASDSLIEKIKQDKTLEQVRNVAMLPGIIEKSIAMPDAHQGYGFPVGGVASFDIKKGIISPGGIGYDINCGVRLLVSDLTKKEFIKKRDQILEELYKNVPSGVGKGGNIKFNEKEIDEILENGVHWLVEKGYGTKKDIEKCEDSGCIKGANSSKVSKRAKARGKNQLGTLGAGNHFLEVQFVEKIFDKKTAGVFGLEKENQICVLIHSGSRGLGHQTASDYIKAMEKEFGTEKLPDRELACSPIKSKLGRDYLEAMRAAANFAFANRHIIMFQTRKSFKKYFPACELKLVYDVAHNVAKFEEFLINGKKKILCVHRKGATRSFGKKRKELPKIYQRTGQPIFIPGSMGTYSYVLVGTEKAREISFASTAHGAGRVLSRTFAKKSIPESRLKKQLKEHDVKVKAGSIKSMIEESPEAYKDVNEIVKVSHELGIGNLVARLRPLLVVKG